jgi:NAD-reducing hydrogenase large subunit
MEPRRGALARRLHETNGSLYDEFGLFRSHLFSIVRADGALDLYDGSLRLRDARGQIVLDHLPCADYDAHHRRGEAVELHEVPLHHRTRRRPGWYKVGPLARVQNCDFIPSPLAELERQAFVAHGEGEPIHAPLAYHWARMIEMLHAAEVIRSLLDDPDLLSDNRLAEGPRQREGVGIIEAPRGTLIHHYRVGDDDLVSYCNLIVSTTHNNQAMNEAVRQVARRYLDGRQLTEGLLNHIEVAIRAFDPCLSCATHALGKMPLAVELVDADGSLVDSATSGG